MVLVEVVFQKYRHRELVRSKEARLIPAPFAVTMLFGPLTVRYKQTGIRPGRRSRDLRRATS